MKGHPAATSPVDVPLVRQSGLRRQCMPMKTLGWVLSSAGLVLAAGCAHKPPPTAATGPTSPEGSPIHQPAGDEHVQTYDLHRSGKPDVWVYSVTTQDASGRPVERRVRKEADLNGDGRVDIVDYFDEAGQGPRETLALDYDGKVDSTLYFEKGKRTRSEKGLDGDGRVDTWSYYDADEKLSRKERDVKG